MGRFVDDILLASVLLCRRCLARQVDSIYKRQVVFDESGQYTVDGDTVSAKFLDAYVHVSFSFIVVSHYTTRTKIGYSQVIPSARRRTASPRTTVYLQMVFGGGLAPTSSVDAAGGANSI